MVVRVHFRFYAFRGRRFQFDFGAKDVRLERNALGSCGACSLHILGAGGLLRVVPRPPVGRGSTESGGEGRTTEVQGLRGG